MADSSITRNALAQSLKLLMNEKPFNKITISDICGRCNMSRKSFYYHFKDKYDLINWIFDNEFAYHAESKPYDAAWKYLEDLCDYFYTNRDFYCKVLKIKGQNSFGEHFRQKLLPIFKVHLQKIMTGHEVHKFHINFFSEAFIGAIERWLLDKNCMQPQEFLRLLKSCIHCSAISICKEMDH